MELWGGAGGFRFPLPTFDGDVGPEDDCVFLTSVEGRTAAAT